MRSMLIQSSYAHVFCLACATTPCASTAGQEDARLSYLGTPLNATGGTEPTEAPILIPSVDDDEAAVELDGRLDEAVWRRIPAYDHMTITNPDEGEPAVYRTHTFMFYTERGLYVGAWNEQPPDTFVGRLSGRDVEDITDSYKVVIDSSGSGLYGHAFQVNLGGSMSDATLLPERRWEPNWDGPWRARTSEADAGWTVEMFLPWVMLNMPAVDGVRRMAVGIIRSLARRVEVWSWPATPSTQPQFISRLQPIALRDVALTQEVSLFPYVAIGRDIARSANDRRAGLDVFWRPSSAFSLSAAVNPDFGQVDADDVVVNLTAFETFFPEKRLFFLENQDVFNAGEYGYRTATTLLHTRRIGAAVGSRRGAPDDREGRGYAAHDAAAPVDLLLATKAVAQVGRSRYGVLVAAEDDSSLDFADGRGSGIASGRDFGALRYQLEDTADGVRKALGWLTTIADHPHRRAIVHAMDGHYRTSNGAWNIDSQIISSDVAGERGWGGLLNVVGAPRRGDQHLLSFATYDDALDLNDLGYLQRNDFTHLFYEYWWRRQDYEHIRETSDWVSVQTDFNNDGQMTTGALIAHKSWRFNNDTSFDVHFSYDAAHWDDRSSRGHGVFKLPPSAFAHLGLQSPRDHRIATATSIGRRREALGGQNSWANWSVTLRPTDRTQAATAIRYENQDAWLVWQGAANFGAFATERWALDLQFGVFFNARQHLEIRAQWVVVKAFESGRYRVNGPTYLDPVAREAGRVPWTFAISDLVIQTRYRWQIAPLSDLFVVYNRMGDLPGQGRRGRFLDLLDESLETPSEEGILVKLRYRFGL